VPDGGIQVAATGTRARLSQIKDLFPQSP